MSEPTAEAVTKRLALAEEVCWTLLLAMHLDVLSPRLLTQGERDFIAEPMQTWADAAVATGLLEKGDDE